MTSPDATTVDMSFMLAEATACNLDVIWYPGRSNLQIYSYIALPPGLLIDSKRGKEMIEIVGEVELCESEAPPSSSFGEISLVLSRRLAWIGR